MGRAALEGMMELNAEQIESILESALPDVTERLKESLVKKIEWQVTDEASKQVRDYVSEWVVREVIPEIESSLIASKDGIVSSALIAGPKIAEMLSARLAEELGKKLGESWSRAKIFEAMFK